MSEVVVIGEIAEEPKLPRIFLRNPDSGEPWACIADLPLDEIGRRSVSDFVTAEIEGMIGFDETHLVIEVKVKLMTEAEVEALPEM